MNASFQPVGALKTGAVSAVRESPSRSATRAVAVSVVVAREVAGPTTSATIATATTSEAAAVTRRRRALRRPMAAVR